MKNDDLLFDLRVVDKNIREGTVKKSDYDKYLKSLPDRGKEVEWSSADNLAPKSYMKGVTGSAEPEPHKET